MDFQQQTPPFLLDSSLYCQEDCCFENEDFEQTTHQPLKFNHDLFWEEDELSSLFSKEQLNELCYDLENDQILAESRRYAVDWILKVVGHYSFSSLTAVLAVNYLDRFLISFEFQKDKLWMIQLLAVACLSLGAKMEETDVPLLLDIQVEEPPYLFDAKTIKRMEILVLSTLKWKMNPVTPVSFLDYFTRRLGLKDNLCWEFHKRCDSLLLNIISDCRFMCYLPSVIATAIMLLVINSLEPCITLDYQTQLMGILAIDENKLQDCCKLIQELISEGYGSKINKRKFGTLPGSPKGVMDLCFRSDSSNDSWAVTTSTPPSVSSSPEPMSKKMKQQNQMVTQIGTEIVFCNGLV